jgi:putative lipoprotein
MPVIARRFALLSAALLLGACSFQPPPQVDAPLEGTTWEVVEIRGVPTPPESQPVPFLLVRSGIGEVAGNTGCNAFNGPYRATGNELIMGPLASTRRACALPAVSDFETIMFAAMEDAQFYVIRLNELFLYEGSEPIMRLRRSGR